MFQCRFCQKEFERAQSLEGHHAQCKPLKLWKENTLTKDFLQNEYIEKERSAIDIANSFGFVSSTIVDRQLQKLGFSKRGHSQAKLTKFVREKTKQTNLERYGEEHNFSKNHPSRKEWEERLFLEEGITNVFQRPEIVEQIAAKLAEYKTDPRYGSRISSHHRKINEFIRDELGIKTKLEHKVDRFYYDIFVEPNFIIEVNGDLFHANPRKYKENDLLNSHIHTDFPVYKIWERDKIKNETVINSGYKLLVVWQMDMEKDFEQVKRDIQTFLEIKR